MKTLQNKKTEIKTNEGVVDYATLVKTAVNTMPTAVANGEVFNTGLTASEMKQRIRIVDVIDAAIEEKKDDIEFEDADVKTLQSCVESMKWSFINKDILQFCEDVASI